MKFRFVVRVAIAAILVTTAGVLAEAGKDRASVSQPADRDPGVIAQAGY